MAAYEEDVTSSGPTRQPTDTYTRGQMSQLVDDIKKCRIRWLKYVLRMPQQQILHIALRWTPPGKRTPGRLKLLNTKKDSNIRIIRHGPSHKGT